MSKGKVRQVWKYYEVKDGKVVRKKRECPICGNGVFLAEHKDRYSCGRCGYTEWKKPRKLKWVPEAGVFIVE